MKPAPMKVMIPKKRYVPYVMFVSMSGVTSVQMSVPLQ
jgi:hypothetical protein